MFGITLIKICPNYVSAVHQSPSPIKMVLLCLPWGIDSAVVGCCLVACMLLMFAPGVAFVLLACLPIPLTGLKSSLLNEKGQCMLFATGFMSPCVASSPWVAPE